MGRERCWRKAIENGMKEDEARLKTWSTGVSIGRRGTRVGAAEGRGKAFDLRPHHQTFLITLFEGGDPVMRHLVMKRAGKDLGGMINVTFYAVTDERRWTEQKIWVNLGYHDLM